MLTRGVDRLPCLEEAEVNPKRAWAGLYEMTPDHHPVLGPVKDLPGFFLANGFSGHGVMHSPATGRILADLILHGRCDLVDTSLLGFDRFAAGRLLHEAGSVSRTGPYPLGRKSSLVSEFLCAALDQWYTLGAAVVAFFFRVMCRLVDFLRILYSP